MNKPNEIIPFVYECTECGEQYSRDDVRYLCPVCEKEYAPGSPLRGVLAVVFDYERIKDSFNKDKPDWPLFSPVEKKYFPNYPVGDTPFYSIPRFASHFNLENVWIKNDSLNPSGSLKDRASFLVAAEANRIGVKQIVCASTGNAASSLAAVCAADGKEAVIFVPASAPKAKLAQIILCGAKVIPVKGTYDDAFKLSLEFSRKNGGLNRNTAYHPLTIEGKKTVGLEIFYQNGFQSPDAIIIPVGDGVIISGVYKAFYDLYMAGLTDKIPKMICVQAENSSAIHKFIKSGVYKNEKNPVTIADSISVSAPSNADMAKRAVLDSGGFSVVVSDEEILAGQKTLAETTGIFAEPSASVTVTALRRIADEKLLNKKEQIVILVTGHGLKDVDTSLKSISIPEPVSI